MIEKILSRLEEERKTERETFNDEFSKGVQLGYAEARKIVQEVAKEYDAFDVIYKKVCELEKQYAKGAEDWENVNSCIRLENLLQYFKEELKAPYQKGE